ncbi:Ger(x)C family spore germination protein [Neobacillus ginsengisoli]|uniref:Ger(X)C family germination protein n=1 Tax=Neobacillus ginsengisoli TaxID=904295 RepID=A0ABT9Y532_9BACI|nr:Ger(x)C family spore germination protein [Neobacillus ginsengisoli]MDQ0202287.1 Ger(x)C family germination protein [Neobacillus ginsengisoli]
MRKIVFFMYCLLIVFLLGGCWDQDRLVKKSLINGVSFDAGKDGKILGAIRALRLLSKGGGQFEAHDELYKADGYSGLEISQNLNKLLAGELDISKTHVIIIGEKMAKKGIIPLLEPIYRSKKTYLGSKIIIGRESGFQILSTEEKSSPIAFDILQLIESVEATGNIPKVSIFSLWSKIWEPGKDIVIPMVEKTDSGIIKIGGLALFNGQKYSGISLPEYGSPILLILLDELHRKNILNFRISNSDGRKEPISMMILKLKRKVKRDVNEANKKIHYTINLSLSLRILSFPQQAFKEIDVNKVNKQISAELTKQANLVTKTLQKADCDALGIGREIESNYPELWKKINWKEEYKNIKIDTKIKAKIIRTGTLF